MQNKTNRKILIVSTSTVHGQKYLEYLRDTLTDFYSDVMEVLFIPYARPSGISHDDYTAKAADFFLSLGKQLRGIHTYSNQIEAVKNSRGIFIGGGNTFVLLHALYQNGLIKPLQEAVENGTPYLGTSAGCNMTGLTIGTTNDMPVIYPPAFEALQLVPFNINPHYIDPDAGSTHMGETRETRIFEFHQFNDQPVVGLREGSWIAVRGMQATLHGNLSARLFRKNMLPQEISSGSDLSFLL